MNNPVWALTGYNNQLIAGGLFTTAGGTSANKIAAWDGSSWSALGSGTNYGVSALTVYNSQLIAGGYFDMAGNKMSPNIAAWTKGSSDAVGGDEEPVLPASYALKQNHPNPFNPTTIIEYTLPRQSRVTISVYNIAGQKVITLLDGDRGAGTHRVTWDGTDQNGRAVATGIYLYRLQTDKFVEAKKMLLMK